jgi:TAP42-like family
MRKERVKFFRREANKEGAFCCTSPLPHHHTFFLQPTTTIISYKPTTMAEQSIKSLFSSAESQRKDIEASWDSNTATYQQNLAAAIATYDDCLKLADRLSLFSPNETLEDLTTGDLQCVSTAVPIHPANL